MGRYVVRRLLCGSINVPSLSSSLSAGKIVGCIMLGMLYLYTQLLFLISAYTVLGYFFIRTYHFQGLRMQFQSVSLYAATISKFCVYNFRLFRYTHWLFYCSAYAILSNFPTHETFIFLRRNFCSIFPYAMTNFHFAQVALLCEEPDKFQERLSSHKATASQPVLDMS